MTIIDYFKKIGSSIIGLIFLGILSITIAGTIILSAKAIAFLWGL